MGSPSYTCSEVLYQLEGNGDALTTLQSTLVPAASEQLWTYCADPDFTLMVIQTMGAQTAAK